MRRTKSPPLFTAWLIFFTISTLSTLLYIGVVDRLIAFVATLPHSATIDPRFYTCSAASFDCLGIVLISFFVFRWVVQTWIVPNVWKSEE